MKVYILILLMLSFVAINSTNSDWNQLIEGIVSHKKDYFPQNIRYFAENYKDFNLSLDCVQSIDKTFIAYENSEDWVFKLFNSWSKFPPSGLLIGTLTDFGDYDQCLNIVPNEVIGKPQYCLVDISLPLPQPIGKHQSFYHSVNVLPKYLNKSESTNSSNVFTEFAENASFFYWFFIRQGICVPNKCSKQDITLLAKSGTDNFGLILKNISCETSEDFSLDCIQWIALSFFTASILLGIFSTVYTRIYLDDIKAKTNLQYFFQTFSLEINLKKLLSKQTNEEISCIHGIRVLTLIWIIFGHAIEWPFLGIYRNIFSIKTTLTQPQNQPFIQGYYAVETFFFLSGLFTSYVTIKFTKGKYENFNTIGFVIYRILRLVPQMAIFILLTMLLPNIGSGPIWNIQFEPIVENCKRFWWHNLIFMQTFLSIKPNETELSMCAEHTWFIGTDMQLFWIAMPLLMLILKNIRLGSIFTMLTIILATGLSSILIFMNDYPPAHVLTSRGDYWLNDKQFQPMIRMFSRKPWAHASIFFGGLLFGAFLTKQMKQGQINKKWLIWSIVVIGSVFCIYDNLFWVYGQPYNPFISAIVYPLKGLVWSLNLSLVIWMCITGNGGLVNRFLSAKVFIPLSRLTYSVYLTHVWVLWTFWGSKRNLVDTSVYSIISIFIPILVLSYTIGAIFSLLFESPFLTLQSYLRKYLLENRNKEYNIRENSQFLKVNNQDLDSEKNDHEQINLNLLK